MGREEPAVSQQSGQTPSPAADPTAFVRTAAWLLRTQAALVVCGAVLAVMVAGTRAGLALLAGGGIGVLLTAIAALRVVMVPARIGAAGMVGAFYRAMAMKLVAAVVLFVVVARWFAGDFGPILIGYVVTVVAYWLALWRLAEPGRN